MSLVGTSVRRLEDPDLLTGRKRFIADLTAGCEAVAFVRAPVAAARIVGLEHPDGASVFTATDLTGVGSIEPILHRPDYFRARQPLLATDRGQLPRRTDRGCRGRYPPGSRRRG